MAQRATFNTRLGVIAATVGSSVGLGNIWRFPYEAGQNGGGAFLLIYLCFVLVLGVPVMLGEFVIGRGAKANITDSFTKLVPKGCWHYIGYLGILASILILGFYSVVAGWTLEYVYNAITNSMSGKSAAILSEEFNTFITNPYRPICWTMLFLAINYFIISIGVQKGIERASNILMPLLFIILLIFGINSLTMDGAAEGLNFLFQPDFSKINSDVVLSAMGQAFFSLSLGMGCLITYSSYFSNTTNLPRTALTVASLDTLVAVLAGVVIFPAVFTFGLSPAQGPELIFITLPNIFNQMAGGYIWAILFFLLITVAALTSTISLFEVVVAFSHEKFKLSRRTATLITLAIVIVLSTLCSLSYSSLSDTTLFGRNIFDLCDFASSNVLLPLGGLLIALFVGWRMSKSRVREELAKGSRMGGFLFELLLFLLRFVAPISIAMIFLSGLGLF